MFERFLFNQIITPVLGVLHLLSSPANIGEKCINGRTGVMNDKKKKQKWVFGESFYQLEK